VALQVDMTGQVCSDSIGYNFYSGVGGQVDFNRGAVRAKDGRSIIALPSTAKNGTVSRIVPRLSDGAGVVLTRADVHYVVTEYGIAELFGRNIRERVLALAQIAHPDFRNDILKEAKAHNYIYAHQKELASTGSPLPGEFDIVKPLSDGTQLYVRPIRPTDDKMLRDMCYALSERSIAFRFFKPLKAFPHKFVQDFTSCDFTKDMVIVGLIQDMGGELMVGLGSYHLNKATNTAEVSFLVRDEWQAKGIGTDLLVLLTSIAKTRGITGFGAEVLEQNQAMLAMFYNSGYKISTKKIDDMYHITYRFSEV
jgi:hypothetical protein